MRFSDAFLDELRSRVSLEEIVSEVVPLKQKGRRFWGCCPFHNEKTPSFSVDTESQLYYCFGCHKGGTALNFVMEIERLDFPDAVKLLAERAHMALPEDSGGKKDGYATSDEKERIYDANVRSARFYHQTLWTAEGADALKYLYGRGLNDADIRRFGLGASPRTPDGLLRHLEALGFEPTLLRKAGLVSERDGKFHDMFRARVIFPIINAQGRVLGFGGRAMGDAQPKYLNTPDTPVFNKRQGLYAMNFIRKERDVDRFVLVEGYMDTVSLRKHGVRGVVATLGTALTQEQARLIKRYVSEVWISYDGDSAGQKAALRALDIFDEFDGIRPKVIDYPSGQDPDDFVKANGLAGFESLRRYDAAEYRMIRAADGLDLNTQDDMTQYVIRCCAILRKVKNPIEMENHLRALAAKTGYDREILLRQIAQGSSGNDAVPRIHRNVSKVSEDDCQLAEYALLTLLSEGELPKGAVAESDFSEGTCRNAARWLLSGRSAAAFVESIADEAERDRAVRALNYSPLPQDYNERMRLAETSRRTIRDARYRARMTAIEEEIKTADPTKKEELYRQMQAITKDLED